MFLYLGQGGTPIISVMSHGVYNLYSATSLSWYVESGGIMDEA